MSYESLKKIVKRNMLLYERSGQMGMEGIVEYALSELAVIDDPKISTSIDKYYERKDKIVQEHQNLIEDVYKKLKEDL
ncbi:MAG: hypothetical protein JSW00_07285 [Thermoplasmata archaeon]|jgi:hypothetical protein|nr:MAG: hypothetical protein JSW00_07285 [Thermoplasmata archaeon]